MKTITRPPKRDRSAPSESIACRSCGRAVKHPDPSRSETIEVHVPQPMIRASRGFPAATASITVTRCDECAKRRDLAECLLAEHPHVRRAHGQVAIDRLDAALAALDVGSFRGARATAAFARTDAALFDTIEALAPLGGAASWSLAPRRDGNSRRWSHLAPDLIGQIADAIKSSVHRRAEVPMPFVPPGSSRGGNVLPGCLMCGVGTLTVKESDAHDIWGALHRINVVSLGGRTRPEPVAGHLCPRCTLAVEKAGAPGMPAIQRALLAHFGYDLRIGYRLDMTSIRGWAALPVGAAPNAKPWEHLDLDRLGRMFGRWEAKNLLVRPDAR